VEGRGEREREIATIVLRQTFIMGAIDVKIDE
jgi:hypothetical protein